MRCENVSQFHSSSLEKKPGQYPSFLFALINAVVAISFHIFRNITEYKFEAQALSHILCTDYIYIFKVFGPLVNRWEFTV